MTIFKTIHQVQDLKLLEKLAAEHDVPFVQQTVEQKTMRLVTLTVSLLGPLSGQSKLNVR